MDDVLNEGRELENSLNVIYNRTKWLIRNGIAY